MSRRVLLVLIGSIALGSIASIALAQREAPENIGDVVLITGQVLDTSGTPIEDAAVEIWQTDMNGHYDHPNDADPSLLSDDFQYFGTSTTDEDGTYSFLTIKPANYGSRPPHIHVKVKIDGSEVLITQFYFAEDDTFINADRFSAGAGDANLLQTENMKDEKGDCVNVAYRDIVLVVAGNDASGSLLATPAQAEGPFYPVVDFSEYDNNLTSATIDNEPVLLEVAHNEDDTLPDCGSDAP